MENYHENFTAQLQRLLSIVNDGKEGYEKAAEQADSENLKNIFKEFSLQRAQMADDLKNRIRDAGCDADNLSGGPLGSIHRAWLNVKTALTTQDDQAVLETCRNGDLAALDAYDDTLQGTILDSDHKPFLTGQRLLINQALLEIDRLYFDLFKVPNN